MYKKFICFFAFIAGVLLLFTAYYNYYHDETGILNTDVSGKRLTPNQAYCKVRWILKNPDRYDSLIFGSSRVMNINPKNIHDGGKWYNMTYAGGGPEDWLCDIKTLVSHGVKLRTLLIGVDDLSMQCNHLLRQDDVYNRNYRDFDFELIMKLLFHMPEDAVDSGIIEEKGLYFDLYGTGTGSSPWIDEEAERNPDAYREKTKFLLPANSEMPERFEENIQAIKEIKSIANEHDINVIFFMNPVSASTYLNDDHNRLADWRRALAEVSDFYDFTGLNDITTDNYYFNDSSHYRNCVGDLIIERIFDGNERIDGFGKLITFKNHDEHEGYLSDKQNYWLRNHPEETKWLALGRGFTDILPDKITTGSWRQGVEFYLDHVDVRINRHGREDNEASVSKAIVVTGWAMVQKSSPQKTLIVLEGAGKQFMALATPELRMDLKKAFPDSPNAKWAGFSLQKDISGLPSGEYGLHLLVEDHDGIYWASEVDTRVNI